MKLIGLMAVRNEDWVLALSARAALMWCDELVVYLHACTDRSAELVAEVITEHPGRVRTITDDSTVWKEMSHRQAMLEEARRAGATHLAYIDADEVLTGNLLPTIRELISIHTMHGFIVNLPWLALARDPNRVIVGDSYWGAQQYAMIAFKDRPDYHWSSAERGGYDYHQRPPLGDNDKQFANAVRPEMGGLMHLQFLSYDRLRCKQALYQMTEVLRWPGRKPPEQLAEMYGRAVYLSEPAKCHTLGVQGEWWSPYAGLMKHMIIDAEPWQRKEIEYLLAEHGREKFHGLDLFGL